MKPAKAKRIDEKRILEVIDLKTSLEIEYLLRSRIDLSSSFERYRIRNQIYTPALLT